jgi:hypothetical protein
MSEGNLAIEAIEDAGGVIDAKSAKMLGDLGEEELKRVSGILMNESFNETEKIILRELETRGTEYLDVIIADRERMEVAIEHQMNEEVAAAARRTRRNAQLASDAEDAEEGAGQVLKETQRAEAEAKEVAEKSAKKLENAEEKVKKARDNVQKAKNERPGKNDPEIKEKAENTKDNVGKIFGKHPRRWGLGLTIALGGAGLATAVAVNTDSPDICKEKCRINALVPKDPDWDDHCPDDPDCTDYCDPLKSGGVCSREARQERSEDQVMGDIAPYTDFFSNIFGIPLQMLGDVILGLLKEFALPIGLCCLVCCLIIVIIGWIMSKTPVTEGIKSIKDVTATALKFTPTIKHSNLKNVVNSGGGYKNYTKTYILIIFFMFIIYYEQRGK